MHDMNLYTVWFHLMISLNDYDFNFKIILKICQLTLKVKIILANIWEQFKVISSIPILD